MAPACRAPRRVMGRRALGSPPFRSTDRLYQPDFRLIRRSYRWSPPLADRAGLREPSRHIALVPVRGRTVVRRSAKHVGKVLLLHHSDFRVVRVLVALAVAQSLGA